MFSSFLFLLCSAVLQAPLIPKGSLTEGAGSPQARLREPLPFLLPLHSSFLHAPLIPKGSLTEEAGSPQARLRERTLLILSPVNHCLYYSLFHFAINCSTHCRKIIINHGIRKTNHSQTRRLKKTCSLLIVCLCMLLIML